MGPIACPETSATINLRWVTSQKSEDLIYTAAEAWNHAEWVSLFVTCTGQYWLQFCTWGLWSGGNTCMLWKPPKTVPVCPNTPLLWGTEIVDAVLESIPYDQMKNLHHSNFDYSLHWCEHIALASINQTEISCKGQFLGKMVGRSLGDNQRQARELISGPCLCAKARFLFFNRTKSRAVTGLLTGHNTLRRHLQLIELSDSPLCRRCGAEDETSAHILCECEALASLRHAHLASFFLEPEDIRNISLGAIWNFSKVTIMQQYQDTCCPHV